MWRSAGTSDRSCVENGSSQENGFRWLGTLILGALICLIFSASAVQAQSSFSGIVRDDSGGVLPGVTVEASSPVLIEKVRSAVTDETGRYNLVDLRPGTYKLSFSLAGFSTLVRDAVELPGNTS